jgi:hypothetical protein
MSGDSLGADVPDVLQLPTKRTVIGATLTDIQPRQNNYITKKFVSYT